MQNYLLSRKCKISLSIFLFIATICNAQVVGSNHTNYTRADTLRGSLRPERSDYDVQKYHLKLKVDPATKSITGSNNRPGN